MSNTQPDQEAPEETLLARFFNWGRSRDAYFFSTEEEPEEFIGLQNKTNPALFEALDRLAKSLAEYHFNGPAKTEAVPNNLQTGYRMVEKRVVLKGNVSWTDLMQMSRSRSIFLGRRVSGGYVTQIAEPTPIESVDVSVLMLAKEVTLSDRGLYVRRIEGEKSIVIPKEHEAYKHMAAYAEKMKEMGLDPMAPNVRKNNLIPVFGKNDPITFNAEVDSPHRHDESQEPSEPSPDEISNIDAQMDYDPRMEEEGSFEDSEPVQSSSEERDTAPVDSEIEPSIPEDQLELIKPPYVRIGAKTYELNEVDYQAIASIKSTYKEGELRVDPDLLETNRPYDIIIAPDGTRCDLRATVEKALDEAGVPKLKSQRKALANRKPEEIAETIYEIIDFLSNPLFETPKVSQERDPYIDTPSGRKIPSVESPKPSTGLGLGD